MFPHTTFLQLKNIDHSTRVLKTINNINLDQFYIWKYKKFQNCTNLLLNKGIYLRPPIKKETLKKDFASQVIFQSCKMVKNL